MSEVAQRTSDQMMQTLNRTGEQAQELARHSSQNFTVMTEAGTILARGFQDISQEWFGLMQAHVQRNFDGFTALVRCRSIPDYIALQNELVRDRLQHTIDGARRIADVSTRVADEATRTMSAQKPTRSCAARRLRTFGLRSSPHSASAGWGVFCHQLVVGRCGARNGPRASAYCEKSAATTQALLVEIVAPAPEEHMHRCFYS